MKTLKTSLLAMVLVALSVATSAVSHAQQPDESQVLHRTVNVEGLEIFIEKQDPLTHPQCFCSTVSRPHPTCSAI